MKCVKYIYVLVLVTFVYVLLSVTVGQNGFNCYKQLENEKKKICLQTAEIENLNTELKLEYSALLNDKAVIAAYARKLDYVNKDEKLVKIKGIKSAQNALYETGIILRHEEPLFLSESVCKMLAVVSGLLLCIILILIDISKGKINFSKPKSIQEIPLYDLPQV